MTLATANVRFIDRMLRFFAPGSYLHAALEGGCKRTVEAGGQLQVFTGIGALDARHRAGFTQVGRPALTRSLE
ncbi:MAG: hypothetical protein Fur0043_15960 [Anaerolineales bacterium]